jgi:hypothetical protein
MKRSALSPADRKTFDRWATAVAAFYALLTICLFVSMIYSSRSALNQQAASSNVSAATGSVSLLEKRQ